MKARIGGFLWHILFLCVIVLSQIQTVFSLSKRAFIIELAVIFGIVAITILSCATYIKSGVNKSFFFVYTISACNALLLSLLHSSFLGLSFVVSVVGMIFSSRDSPIESKNSWKNEHIEVEEIKPERAISDDELKKTVQKKSRTKKARKKSKKKTVTAKKRLQKRRKVKKKVGKKKK